MRHRYSRLLLRYMFSYLSIALLACALIGLSLFYVSSAELNGAILQSEQTDLTAAANDLETQYYIMEDISYRVSTTIFYRSFYIKGGISHQKKLIEDLAKYESYSPIVDQYFFYRKGEPFVWKTSAVNTFSVYALDVLGCDRPQLLYDAVNGLESFSTFRLDDSRVILLFPMHVDTNRSMACDAVLGFIVSEQSLMKRLDGIFTKIGGPVHIYLYGQSLFPGSDPAPPDYAGLIFDTGGTLAKTQGLLGSRSPDGVIGVVTLFNAGSINERLGYFKAISVLVIILTVLFVSILGYFAARMNYRPIHELAAKYGIAPANRENTNEFNRIDAVLRTALERSSLLERRMSEYVCLLGVQKDMLIQQFFLLILHNGYYPGMEKRIKDLSLVFPGDFFCVFTVQYTKTGSLDEDRLFSLIHDLSDEAMALFCVHMKIKNTFSIIVNVIEESRFAEASELIEAVGSAENAAFDIRQGSVCEEIKGLSASLADALISMHKNETVIKNGLGDEIIAYIREHACDYDIDFGKLSAQFNCSPKNLRYFIKNETGKSLREYLNILRIAKARELLNDEALTISEIAQKVGYLSVSYFIKNFKGILGVTPERYRLNISI